LLGFTVLFAWNMTCYVHLNAMIFFPNLQLKKTNVGTDIERKFKINPQFFSIGSDVYFVVIGIGAIFSILRYSLVFLSVMGNLYWIAVFIFIFSRTKNVK
jgi:hypothetical protein